MASTRPKLELDEQSFQGLLAAAFTIQQHADLLKQVTAGKSSNPVRESESEIKRVCWHCGAPIKDAESRCSQCGWEESRPGDRMQQRYASLWEMSQEHGVRQNHPPEHGEESALELVSPGQTAAPEVVNQLPAPSATDQDPPQIETETNPPLEIDDTIESILLEGSEDDSVAQANSLGAHARSVLHELRQQLELHRADLYLGIAILVAFLALLWPAPVPLQKPRLDPWQRALVSLGIAEAPAPPIHYRGNPNIEVWVDPHTALYYCPGEDLYGKTADGRLTPQRDAQADRFEPANRATCN